MRRTEAAPRVPPGWLDRAEWWLGLALTALAVVLHLRILTHAGPLWRDEANSAAVAGRPSVAAMFADLEHESFPILPFAALRAWSAAGMGATDFRLRLFGFLVGVAILGALWWNRRLTRGEVPILALALFALNPVVLRWGDSLRGYGLGALSIVLVFGLVYRMAILPSPSTVAAAAVAAVVAVQCVYQNALLLAATCAAAATVAWSRRRLPVAGLCAAIGAVAAASLIPYAGVIARAREHFVVITLSADFGRIGRAFLEALGFAGARQSPSASLVAAAWLTAFGAALAAGLGAFRAGGRDERSAGTRDLARYGSVVALLAPAIFFLFVYRLRFLTEPWYFIVLLGALGVSLDAALCAWRGRTAVRIAKLTAAALAAILAVATGYPSLGSRQTNVDLVAGALAGQAAREDLIVLNPWFYGVSFGRYFRGETPTVLVPPLSDREIHRFDLVKRMMVMQGDPLEPLFARMTETLRGGHRVWIVGAVHVPPRGRPPLRLPPASDATGWYSAPYLAAWSQQLGVFLQSRAARARRVDVRVEGLVSPYENLPLVVADGFKQAD